MSIPSAGGPRTQASRFIFVTPDTYQLNLQIAIRNAGHSEVMEIREDENPRKAAEFFGRQGVAAAWLDSQGGGTTYTRYTDGEYRCHELPVSENNIQNMVDLVLALNLSVSICYGYRHGE